MLTVESRAHMNRPTLKGRRTCRTRAWPPRAPIQIPIHRLLRLHWSRIGERVRMHMCLCMTNVAAAALPLTISMRLTRCRENPNAEYLSPFGKLSPTQPQSLSLSLSLSLCFALRLSVAFGLPQGSKRRI